MKKLQEEAVKFMEARSQPLPYKKKVQFGKTAAVLSKPLREIHVGGVKSCKPRRDHKLQPLCQVSAGTRPSHETLEAKAVLV